jgi:hypothetical protein
MSSLLVFNRDYRLEIQSVMWVFATGFMNYCPLTSSLVSSPPLPCVNKYIVCNKGEYGVIGGEGASDR